MDSGKSPGAYGGGKGYPGRRTREERRSLSESLADGTSKFFSSMVAKKNGIFSDLSSKIENTFAPKTDTISNSTGSEGSVSPPTTPPAHNTPPPRPPPPKRLPSMGSSREKENLMKRMSSMPAYTRTDSQPECAPEVFSAARNPYANHKGTVSEERFSVNGMNISFDQPIYNNRDNNSSEALPSPASSSAPADESNESPSTKAGHVSGTSSFAPQPKPAPRYQKPVVVSEGISSSPSRSDSQKEDDDNRQCQEEYNQGYGPASSSSSGECSDRGRPNVNDRKTKNERRRPSGESTNAGRRRTRSGESDRKPGSDSNASDWTEDAPGKQRAPKFTSTKRRSSTVDEILFDDYVEPGVDDVISKDEPPENLISFEPDPEAEVAGNRSSSSSEDGNDGMLAGASIASSDTEFGGAAPMQRSASVGSEKSWSSNYSVDSQPDDMTLECMEFMKSFVDKVFQESEDILQTEKAKFGELCQYFPGRLWFSRYVNSQRVHNKRVNESIFFRLVQYFAVCLFECNEAEDFSPAKTLMNMCFTFYNEAPSAQGKKEKVFLFMYMRDQPIWQSLRFWNAAYFDAVQCERARRPMPTSSDGNDTVTDDKQFQENITFGQLGTFACNMRAFGLSKELCLEFLRKQSTIANLRKDQVKLLKDNIERVKEKET